MKKRIALVVALSMALVACSQKSIEVKNDVNNSSNNEISNEKDSRNEKSQIVSKYYGEDQNFEVFVTITEFTDEDAEDIKKEYGSDSDEYLSLEDDRPIYRVYTTMSYIGDGVEDIEKLNDLNTYLEYPTGTYGAVFQEEPDIMKALQGGKNLTESLFIHEHDNFIDSDESIHLTVSSDTMDEFNFTIEAVKEN